MPDGFSRQITWTCNSSTREQSETTQETRMVEGRTSLPHSTKQPASPVPSIFHCSFLYAYCVGRSIKLHLSSASLGLIRASLALAYIVIPTAVCSWELILIGFQGQRKVRQCWGCLHNPMINQNPLQTPSVIHSESYSGSLRIGHYLLFMSVQIPVYPHLARSVFRDFLAEILHGTPKWRVSASKRAVT